MSDLQIILRQIEAGTSDLLNCLAIFSEFGREEQLKMVLADQKYRYLHNKTFSASYYNDLLSELMDDETCFAQLIVTEFALMLGSSPSKKIFEGIKSKYSVAIPSIEELLRKQLDDWNSHPINRQDFDALCDRFEEAISCGQSPIIENYLELAPSASYQELLGELLSIEAYHLQRDGNPLNWSSYYRRFSEDSELVDAIYERHVAQRVLFRKKTKRSDIPTPPIDPCGWLSKENIEEITANFNTLWMQGQGPKWTDWLDHAKNPGQKESLAELLIPIEINTRKARGEDINSLQDYPNASPKLLAIVNRLLECSTGINSALFNQSNKTGAAICNTESTSIGPYKLIQKIGEGGMGEVWLAEQTYPVRRSVALKLIKNGLANRRVIARFEAERQALCLMDHPNIAKILDAGSTQEGHPFFVMELVEGTPITKYCDENMLSVDDRLSLFVPVCQAVQHAHQKGVIHRDLKPSNILVCEYDGKPVPKVIDFGLAKAFRDASLLTDMTISQELGQIVGSLPYMSPEQADENQVDIDTRTDIYSLGATLYELLTGATPLDSDLLKQKAIFQVLADIRDTDPVRPSIRLSSASQEAVSSVSHFRRTDLSKLKHILRGDLDWIVMKALEKDRSRRYEAATTMANDILNYLRGQVVTARPPTTVYLITKYVKRNRRLVITLSSIAGCLLLAFIGIGWFAWKADTALGQKDQAIQMLDKSKKMAEQLAKISRANESEALKGKSKTEALLARSAYYLAESEWQDNRPAEAQKTLWSVPEIHRNIEWYHSAQKYENADLILYDQDTGIAAISQNGEKIAYRSGEGTVKVWDSNTGKVTQTISGIVVHRLSSLSIAKDGSKLISVSRDGIIQHLDIESGKETKKASLNHKIERKERLDIENSRIASWNLDKLQIWDINSGAILKTLKLPNLHRMLGGSETEKFENLQYCSDISPDFTKIVFVSHWGRVVLIDAESGVITQETNLSIGPVYSVCFSPSGNKIVAGLPDGNIALISPATCHIYKTIRLAEDEIEEVAFSPDGDLIAAVCSDRYNRPFVKVVDATTGGMIKKFPHSLGHLSFSPDGRKILICGDSIKFWDISNELESFSTFENSSGIQSICYSSDGLKLATADRNSTIRVFDSTSGALLNCFTEKDHKITSILFGPGSKWIAIGTTDSKCIVRQVDTGEVLNVFTLETNSNCRGTISPLGRWILTEPDKNHVQLRRIFLGANTSKPEDLTGEALVIPAIDPQIGGISGWYGKGDSQRCFSFNADENLLAAGNWLDSFIYIWDLDSGKQIRKINSGSNGTASMCFNPASNLFARLDFQGTIKIWDAETWDLVSTCSTKTFLKHGAFCLAFSPDGSRLAQAGHDGLVLWDTMSGEQVLRLPWNGTDPEGVAFRPDGDQIVGFCKKGEIRFWNVERGSEVFTLSRGSGFYDHIQKLAISSDGRSVATLNLNSNEVFVWDLATKKETGRISRGKLRNWYDATPQLSRGSVLFTSDGSKLFLGDDDGSIRMFDSDDLTLLQTFSGHSDLVSMVALSEDEEFLLSSSLDGTARVWNIKEGRSIRVISELGPYNKVAFIPNSDNILLIDYDGNRTCYNFLTGNKVQSDSSFFVPDYKGKSADGRWLIVPVEDSVAVVDLHYNHSQQELTRRRKVTQINVHWHRRRAIDAERRKDWFSATFHRAWALRGEANSGEDRVFLQSNFAKLAEESSEQANLLKNLYESLN
jgi:WD40 repeat protein/serine/threonine protein kinase